MGSQQDVEIKKLFNDTQAVGNEYLSVINNGIGNTVMGGLSFDPARVSFLNLAEKNGKKVNTFAKTEKELQFDDQDNTLLDTIRQSNTQERPRR